MRAIAGLEIRGGFNTLPARMIENRHFTASEPRHA